MLRKLFRLILGIGAGTALAYYFTSDRGRTTLERAAERLRAGGLDPSRVIGSSGASGFDEGREAIEAKIEETRRRLREQLDKVAHQSPE